jgi:type IV pilus assembly protein PilB
MSWWDSIPSIDLTDVTIPSSIIDLVPESVARENTILPLSYDDGALKIVTINPTDLETMEKLQFILNKNLCLVLASYEQLIAAIDRHYGQ